MAQCVRNSIAPQLLTPKNTCVVVTHRETVTCSERHGLKTSRGVSGNEDIKARMKITQDQLVRNERTLMTAWGRDAQKGLNAIHKLILEKKVPNHKSFLR